MTAQSSAETPHVVTEINLTSAGERAATLLRRFEDVALHLHFYTQPPTLDTSGERWTLGNDALLILSGDVDDTQTIAASSSPHDLLAAFTQRIVGYFDEIGLDFPVADPDDDPQEFLRMVWEDFLRLGLVTWEDVDETTLISVPAL